MMKRILGSFFLLMMLTVQSALAAIAIDNTSVNNTNSGSSLTVSHTTGSGSDRFMLVGISLWNEDYETVTNVTYGGTALTKIGHINRQDDSRVEIWKLLNPSAGTANVQITFNSNVQKNSGAGVMTFTGVDQSDPHDNFVSSQNESSQPNITVTNSATGDFVLAVMAAEQQDDPPVLNAGDQRWSFKVNGNNKLVGSGATLAGSNSVFFRWTLDDSDDWVIGAVSLNPSSGGGGAIPNPEIEYRMDELQWQGTANEVVDNTGNNHDGTAQGGARTVANGAICRAGEFDGSNDYFTAIDLSSLRGTSSISYWVKTSQVGSSVNYLAPGITGVEQSGGTNDIFWGWIDNAGRVGVTVGDNSSTKSSTAINNNAWRHIVLTRNAATGAYQIFIDGSLNASGTSTAGTISNSFSSIGRIEDTGGSPEYFQGQLDEVLIYDSVLNSTHVTQIYTNQSAGNNWDGTSRTCPANSSAPLPKAEFRLDELSWSGALNEVVDSVGIYSGEAINTSPVAGKICNAADFSATNSNSDADSAHDYIKLDGDIYSNQGDFSISLWVKTANTSDQSLVSGATSGSANEMIMWFTSSTRFRPFLNNGNSGNANVGSFADDTWRHLVWTRSGTQNCLYMDKVLQGCRTLGGTNITLANNGLVLAQEQDSVGGGFAGSQAFDGLMDEVLFYDKALSSSEITLIHDLQDAGKNLDGTDRTCPVENITPVADWRFDENSWSGTDSVLDASGNDYHGTAVSTSPTSDAQLCNAVDLSAAGTSDYLRMNKDAMDGLSDFTVIVWAKTTGTQDSTILSAASGNSDAATNEAVMYFDNNNRFWPTITDSPFDTNTQLSSTTPSMRDGNWHQLAWTRDASGRQSCFFFDGVSQGCTTHPDADDIDPLTVVTNGLIIGQEQDSIGGGFDSGQDWEGLLDEMLIFSSVLNQTQITEIRTNIINSNNWDGTPRSCASSVSYYDIDLSSPSLTCEAATITITARDASDQVVAPASGTQITLSAELVSGSNVANTFSPSTFTFDGTQTSTTVQLTRTSPGELDIDVTDGVVTDQDGQPTDPNIVFSDVAFRFYANNVVNDIGTQIAGKLNTLAPDNQTITIRAIETDTTTGQCATLKPAANFSMEFGYECKSPNTCSGPELLTVNNTQISGFANGSGPVYDPDNVMVNFDSTGTGNLEINYSDAGQIQLFARANVLVSGGSGSVEVTGSSNSFVVRPFAFGFPSITAGAVSNPGGDETTGDGFVSAGSDFDVSLNAYLYQAADDDDDNNGIPDAGADVTDNGVTPNYVGTATLAVDTFTPSVDLAGILSGSTAVSLENYATRGGNDVTATLQYDEVGSINLIATMDDYLGDSFADISSLPVKIGRFYPHYFALLDDSISTFCTSPSFTYMQRPFSGVAYKIEARAANDAITEKYDLAYYTVSTTSGAIASFDLVAEDSDDSNNLSNRIDNQGSLSGWSSGVVDRTSSPLTSVVFQRGGGEGGLEDGPYLQMQLGIRVASEADGVDFLSANKNMDVGSSGSCSPNCPAITLGNAQDLRYGRIRIQSAHAPETEDLPVPFTVEYWNGSAFVTNADDSCSVIQAGQIEFNSVATSTSLDVSYDQNADTDTTGSFTDLSGSNVTASNGSFGLRFSAPGVGVEGNDNTGSFPVEVLNLDDWLRYDWNEDGSADDANAQDAIITFGRARGSDRMIFWQERYQ